MTPRPVILVADHIAPMRRAVRRLLGETRFEWEEAEGPAELLERSRRHPPALLVVEDEAIAAIPQLRAQGCDAPVVRLTNGHEWVPPTEGIVVLDRLHAGAYLQQVVERLLNHPHEYN